MFSCKHLTIIYCRRITPTGSIGHFQCFRQVSRKTSAVYLIRLFTRNRFWHCIVCDIMCVLWLKCLSGGVGFLNCCFLNANTRIEPFFYVVVVISPCSNNFIDLLSAGYSEEFILFNCALNFLYGFDVCCLEQRFLQDFYFQAKGFDFRITNIKVRKLGRRHLFGKIPHEIIFNGFSIDYHCSCLLQ